MRAFLSPFLTPVGEYHERKAAQPQQKVSAPVHRSMWARISTSSSPSVTAPGSFPTNHRPLQPECPPGIWQPPCIPTLSGRWAPHKPVCVCVRTRACVSILRRQNNTLPAPKDTHVLIPCEFVPYGV